MKILLTVALVIGLNSAFVSSGHAQSSDLNGGPLGIIPRERLFCSKTGWRFPGLIWGERPVHACILRMPARENVFGGPFGF
jgi:hypothetical protein